MQTKKTIGAWIEEFEALSGGSRQESKWLTHALEQYGASEYARGRNDAVDYLQDKYTWQPSVGDFDRNYLEYFKAARTPKENTDGV